MLIFRLFLLSVRQSGDNLSLIHRLLTQFQNSIQSAYPFYYYIGSAVLWQRHVEMLNRMQETIQQVRWNISHQNEEQKPATFDRLPLEMQYAILRRLDNDVNIIHVGMINSNFYRITQELLLWRQLCLYHFGEQTRDGKETMLNEKILRLIKRQQKELEMDKIDWKKLYFKFKRRYGRREVYAEMIHQCQLCKCLFWQVSLFSYSCIFYRISIRIRIIRVGTQHVHQNRLHRGNLSAYSSKHFM